MKKLILILLSALSLTAMAQQKVAVLTPICRDNSVNNFYQQIIRGALESAVTATDEYVAFDRTAFDKVLEEHQFQRSGAVDDAQIRRMGMYAGVDLVIVTEVSASEGYMTILAKIVNIETGESSKGVNELMEQNPPTVQASCEKLAKKLFGLVNIETGQRKGEIQLAEGKYVGEILNGKPHGEGVLVYNSGWRYEGHFENGERNGFGTQTYNLGDKYVGEWKNGMKCGHGTFYSSNGDKYEGNFGYDNANGWGTKYYANGGKYVGNWEAGRKSGRGTRYYTDSRWEGSFKDGKAEGVFTIYWNDGDIETGKYVNNKREGEWTRKTSTGKYLKGWYSNGVMTTQYH